MFFPNTNKIRKPSEETVGDNIKLLEEHLAKIDWFVFLRGWTYFFTVLLVTVFAFIVVIRFALSLF